MQRKLLLFWMSWSEGKKISVSIYRTDEITNKQQSQSNTGTSKKTSMVTVKNGVALPLGSSCLRRPRLESLKWKKRMVLPPGGADGDVYPSCPCPCRPHHHRRHHCCWCRSAACYHSLEPRWQLVRSCYH